LEPRLLRPDGALCAGHARVQKIRRGGPGDLCRRIWTHLAFAKDRKLNFPLLSDFEPKGAVSSKYGAYNARIGESARALFVIDRRGTIVWSMLSPDGINPGADGILSALEKLEHNVHPSGSA